MLSCNLFSLKASLFLYLGFHCRVFKDFDKIRGNKPNSAFLHILYIFSFLDKLALWIQVDSVFKSLSSRVILGILFIYFLSCVMYYFRANDCDLISLSLSFFFVYVPIGMFL